MAIILKYRKCYNLRQRLENRIGEDAIGKV